MAKFKFSDLDKLAKELEDLLRKDTGIKDTNVAKMLTRKEAGNFTTLGSRVSNPVNLSKYTVPGITRDKRYYKLKEYEGDLIKDLIKSIRYIQDNGVKLSSTQKANLKNNIDTLRSVQKDNIKSETALLKEGKNLYEVLENQKAGSTPLSGIPGSSKAKSLFDEMADIEKRTLKVKEMADELVKMGAPKDDLMDIALKGMRTQRDGTYRAIAREVLLRDPRLRLPEEIRKSLATYADLNPSTRKTGADPIEVMKKYYGENMQFLDAWMDDYPFGGWDNAQEAADKALKEITDLKPKPEVTKGLSESLQDIVKPLDEDITGGKGKFFDVNETGPADLKDLEAKFFDESGKMNEEGAGIVEEGLKGLEKTNDIERAVENIQSNFAPGDLKYNADVLADELALQRGLIKEGQDLTDLNQRDGMALYDEAYSWLSNQFMKARKAKKEYEAQQAKPKEDNVQSIYASQKEFDDDLYSITQNLIKNDPAFNIEIAKDFFNPGAKTYGWTPDGDKSKLLNIDQRQTVLNRIRDVMKDEEYMQRYGGDFDFSEISDEIFVIPRNKKPK